MTTALEKNTALCPHCGAESSDEDDLCRFCGKGMVSPKGEVDNTGRLGVTLRFLKGKVRPLTGEEHEELFEKTTFNLSNPADPIWDD
ncbi:MAG: hypothetical protein A2521_03015 [Deltaproteobacteria bacterium RIFOXYD12_FULL_57_12]|nr:MAG: hypothetical protein A2521_03015 [Deltaproteobacteria bacterium RIFOXYD12_FULL_57_12]